MGLRFIGVVVSGNEAGFESLRCVLMFGSSLAGDGSPFQTHRQCHPVAQRHGGEGTAEGEHGSIRRCLSHTYSSTITYMQIYLQLKSQSE